MNNYILNSGSEEEEDEEEEDADYKKIIHNENRFFIGQHIHKILSISLPFGLLVVH